MKEELELIGRTKELFTEDVKEHEEKISEFVRNNSFLVIGGAGSIGQAVVKEIFSREPKKLHVVDISENNLVELVRDIRSSLGYIKGDFKTFAIDCGSLEFEVMFQYEGNYDFVLNLSALKHVRSEKDPYTLMRMIDVNILNTESTILQAIKNRTKKYFCVSTDKAANPVNMMGASKRIMELFLMRRSLEIPVSTARFANISFSDGSLLYGFMQRIQKCQPISAPCDIKRYFMTQQESGQLCLMSCLLGENRDIFFPKLDKKVHLQTFSEIAVKFLNSLGYVAVECETEEEARCNVERLSKEGKWPCYFFTSDTTGEKDIEEFFKVNETFDMKHFKDIGIIKNKPVFDAQNLMFFEKEIIKLKERKEWKRSEIIELFKSILPELEHKETGKFLDRRM